MKKRIKGCTKIPPFRMIGNVYFVGTYEASSHLIDTGDGLILIDTGYEITADVVLESIKELGFDVKDVKIILHSHGHYDHTDGTPKILKFAPQAKTYLSFKDVKYLDGWTPDYDILDGDIIELGNTKIECLFTPGHTEGSVSFFLDVVEDGKTYTAAMFGGSGTNQLKKDFMNGYDVPYRCRGLFFDSVERLLERKVDVMIGNHSWHNRTREKREQQLAGAKVNPFIDPTEWEAFLKKLHAKLWEVIEQEITTKFINYAHRGASEYYPENTISAFRAGLEMGANGIETDVQKTKDGKLVLFHDDTLERVVGESGGIKDYTYEELQKFDVKKGELTDKIPLFEDFLKEFADKEIAFAIELKVDDIEKEVVDLIYKYGIEEKTTVTAFSLERIRKTKAYAPNLRIGFLTKTLEDERINALIEMEADEVCPHVNVITAETVKKLHRLGFNVRAWGVAAYEERMKKAYEAGTDGMTINAPDFLTKLIAENNA